MFLGSKFNPERVLPLLLNILNISKYRIIETFYQTSSCKESNFVSVFFLFLQFCMIIKFVTYSNEDLFRFIFYSLYKKFLFWKFTKIRKQKSVVNQIGLATFNHSVLDPDQLERKDFFI